MNAMIQAKATSFATRQDLAAFAKAVTNGKTPTQALAVGDNGIGAWDEPTWQPHGDPICAIPHGKHNAKVRVILTAGHQNPFICYCRDIAPAGVIDLNPAALIAAGLDPDTELNDPSAKWEYL